MLKASIHKLINHSLFETTSQP